jgi:hypothetical protein
LRRVFILLLASASVRADFSYQSRIQFAGSEPVVTTRAIKGRRMAILTRRHTSVIDLDAETITEIDFAKKAYAVIPFAQWKKKLDDAAALEPREASFKVSIHAGASASSTKPIGILNAAESIIDIAGASGALNVTVETWVGAVPGYEQMRDFIDKLAEKLGYAFASGLAEAALRAPESLQGFDEALKHLNQSRGAPIESSIKITGSGKTTGPGKIANPDKTIAEASIQLSKFGGGAQLAATFAPPEGFKKVDGTVP